MCPFAPFPGLFRIDIHEASSLVIVPPAPARRGRPLRRAGTAAPRRALRGDGRTGYEPARRVTVRMGDHRVVQNLGARRDRSSGVPSA